MTIKGIFRQIQRLLYRLSIRTKLIAVFLVISIVAFLVTFYMNTNINEALQVIEQAYTSNAQLNELSEALNGIQINVKEYLDTRSSDALNSYYSYEQRYRTLLAELNADTLGTNKAVMEKNINGLSETYLNISNDTVEARRARDISRYRTTYDSASNMYDYLNTYIFSLNNLQFKDNSANYAVLASSLKFLANISMFINIAIAFFNILLIVLLTRQITKPLKDLSVAAGEVAQGNFENPDLIIYSMDEVGVVTKAFNKMRVNIREYISRLTKSMEAENKAKEREFMMENSLKDAQLKYYQAQIHPHFLFNTLNAGAQLAMMENAEKTYSFVQKMSEFFRYSMNNLENDVYLKEEIELVESYLYIMNVRFTGEINFEKRISCDIEGILVPGMILQPLVENSLQYGIRDIAWEGQIILSVDKGEGGIDIRVTDNGIGISKQRLEEIASGELLASDNQELSNGVGIGNVRERLGLYYKTKNLFKIESLGENRGTCVTIFVPEVKDKSTKGNIADV
jgi:Predicted signal transduction protein with a C-terminal ATPase domain